MRDICVTVDVEDFFLPRPAFDTIFARQGSQEFGIGRIMSMLEEVGAAGTFYVDVFNRTTLDEVTLGDACTAIANRGHEVGLHTHPGFPTGVRGYGMTQVMCKLPLQTQQDLIGLGARHILKLTGTSPTTHRAGGYGANGDTLTALHAEGFSSDSSHYFGYVHCPLAVEFPYANVSFDACGVREVPISVTLNRFGFPWLAGRWVGPALTMKIDIDWLDLPALQAQVDACIAQTQSPIVLFLHSYSLLDLNRGLRPSERNIERFSTLLRWLLRKADVQFSTIGAAVANCGVGAPSAGVLPVCRFNLPADPVRWATFAHAAVSVERLKKVWHAMNGSAG